MNDKYFLTTKEAGKMLGVHPLTIKRWVRKGKLKALRLPSDIKPHFRFKYSDIIEMMEGDK